MRKTSRAFYGCPRYAPASPPPRHSHRETVNCKIAAANKAWHEARARGGRVRRGRWGLLLLLPPDDCRLQLDEGKRIASYERRLLARVCRCNSLCWLSAEKEAGWQGGERGLEWNGAGVAEAATRTTIVKGTALHRDKHSCTCGRQQKKLAKVATVVVAMQKLSVTVRLPPSTHGTILHRNWLSLSVWLCPSLSPSVSLSTLSALLAVACLFCPSVCQSVTLCVHKNSFLLFMPVASIQVARWWLLIKPTSGRTHYAKV